jgi:hypothetical protein
MSCRSRAGSAVPPSWPSPSQTSRTGVPAAAIARALASASESGNSESYSPWISRVGAVIRLSTRAGLDAASRSSRRWDGRPVLAACA